MSTPDPLHMTEAQANQIWNDLQVGLAYVGTDGKWLRVNPFLCELLEYTEEELRKVTFKGVTHPADMSDDQDMVNLMLAHKIERYVMTKRYITKTERVITIKLCVSSVLNPELPDLPAFFLSQVLPKTHDQLTNDMHGVAEGVESRGQLGRFLKKEWK